MAKKWVTLTTSSTFNSDDASGSKSERFTYLVSDHQEIKAKLMQLIASGNKDEFQKTLTQHFIYPNRGGLAEGIYKGNHHIRTWTAQEFLTRPVIEALFFEHTALFHELLSAVISAQNKELEMIFHASIKNLAVPASLFSALDTEQKKTLSEQFSALSSIKGVATEFITELNERLQTMSKSNNPLYVLKEKLDLAQLVHSRDKEFIGMSNYKKICVNIVTILLSGCVLNLLNLFITGSFLFFNKNTAQTKIAHIDKVLDQNQLLTPKEQKIAEAEQLQAQAGTTIKPITPAPAFFTENDAAHTNLYPNVWAMSFRTF